LGPSPRSFVSPVIIFAHFKKRKNRRIEEKKKRRKEENKYGE